MEMTTDVALDAQPIRHSLDDWERMMMKRDERLTGSLRGQTVSSSTPAYSKSPDS